MANPQYHIQINETIEPWMLSMVRSVVRQREGKELRLGISSLGGDVNTALSIYQMLRAHGNVTADLMAGFNASAATLIAMGARRVRMSRHSLFLIHKCSTEQFVWQAMNEEQIGQLIGSLQKQQADQRQIDALIANIYMERTGLEEQEIIQMMSRSQWHPADECLRKGFIDEIIDGDQAARLPEGVKNHLDYSGQLPAIPDYALSWFQSAASDSTLSHHNVIMNKKFITVQNLCKCEGFENAAGQEGKLVVSEQHMQVVEDNLAELQGKVGNLGQLESQVTTIKAERDALQVKVSDLEDKVADLEGKLGQQPGGHTATRVDDGAQSQSDFFNNQVGDALMAFV